jgi:hypothetical protein
MNRHFETPHVDRDQNGRRGREHAHDVEECERDRARVRGTPVRLLEQERHLERPTARRRNQRQRLVEHIGEEVAKSSERERGLCLGATTGEDAAEGRPAALHSCLPEDRLADPRFSGENKRRRSVRDLVEKGLDEPELFLSPEHRRRHRLRNCEPLEAGFRADGRRCARVSPRSRAVLDGRGPESNSPFHSHQSRHRVNPVTLDRRAHRTINAQTCANSSDQSLALTLTESHSLHRV